MKLFLLSQNVNDDWDTYDSCVVCAQDENAARLIHPNDYNWINGEWCYDGHPIEGPYSTWTHPQHVQVQYIGEAAFHVDEGAVLCSSFNAG